MGTSLNISFSNQMKLRHNIYGAGGSKRRTGKRGRNVHELFENSGLDAFSILVWAFLVIVMATVNCLGLMGVSFS